MVGFWGDVANFHGQVLLVISDFGNFYGHSALERNVRNVFHIMLQKYNFCCNLAKFYTIWQNILST